jgi:hypothetical protein
MKNLFLTLVLILSVCSLVSVQSAEAKVFRNAYVSFEIPETWNCVLEQTEFVCRSLIEKESKEAIIILTAKETGPADTFESYEMHLNAPKNPAVNSNIASQVKYKSKKVQINDHEWLDGLHFGSEMPNYFTRYLITIKDKLAILVTLTSHKTEYTKYSQDFFNAVKSLRVIASKNLLARNETGGGGPGSESFGAPISGAGDMAGADMGGAPPPKKGLSPKKLMKYGLVALAIILAAIGAYLATRKK